MATTISERSKENWHDGKKHHKEGDDLKIQHAYMKKFAERGCKGAKEGLTHEDRVRIAQGKRKGKSWERAFGKVPISKRKFAHKKPTPRMKVAPQPAQSYADPCVGQDTCCIESLLLEAGIEPNPGPRKSVVTREQTRAPASKELQVLIKRRFAPAVVDVTPRAQRKMQEAVASAIIDNDIVQETFALPQEQGRHSPSVDLPACVAVPSEVELPASTPVQSPDVTDTIPRCESEDIPVIVTSPPPAKPQHSVAAMPSALHHILDGLHPDEIRLCDTMSKRDSSIVKVDVHYQIIYTAEDYRLLTDRMIPPVRQPFMLGKMTVHHATWLSWIGLAVTPDKQVYYFAPHLVSVALRDCSPHSNRDEFCKNLRPRLLRVPSFPLEDVLYLDVLNGTQFVTEVCAQWDLNSVGPLVTRSRCPDQWSKNPYDSTALGNMDIAERFSRLGTVRMRRRSRCLALLRFLPIAMFFTAVVAVAITAVSISVRSPDMPLSLRTETTPNRSGGPWLSESEETCPLVPVANLLGWVPSSLTGWTNMSDP